MRAMQAAREARVEILAPRLASPSSFAYEGCVIRFAELKGKVVLIDCWAGRRSLWCMAKMPCSSS